MLVHSVYSQYFRLIDTIFMTKLDSNLVLMLTTSWKGQGSECLVSVSLGYLNDLGGEKKSKILTIFYH